MAPSAYHPGEHLDRLLDALSDMGAPRTLPPRAKPIQWGRVAGAQKVWLRMLLPGPHIGTFTVAEHHADTLDQAARMMLDLELTAGDGERDAASESLEKA